MNMNKSIQINDNKSLYEIITNTLRMNSQYWFETLLEKGTDVMNTVFPVLTNQVFTILTF